MKDFNNLDTTGLEKLIVKKSIKGVGKQTAKKVVESLNSSNTDEATSVSTSQASKIKIVKDQLNQENYLELKNLCQLLGLGFSKSLADNLTKSFGQDAYTKIKSNPYLLAGSFFGVGFNTADNAAKKLGIEHTSSLRISGAILFFLKEELSLGNCYVERQAFVKNTALLLGFSEDLREIVEKRIDYLESKHLIVKHSYQEKNFYGLKKVENAEVELSRYIKQLCTNQAPLFKKLSKQILTDSLKTNLDSNLSIEQVEALNNATNNQVSIVTGGPGTGKTTLLKSLVKFLKSVGAEYFLCAPTGRASKRMSSVTKSPALTIHRLLGYSPQTQDFLKNNDNKIVADFIIIDEFSMVDLFLAKSLFAAVNHKQTSVLMIGDVDQLPSVGPGQIFKDFIDSKTIKTTVLSQVFRQAATSLITVNAHKINSGNMPVSSTKKQDFFFIKVDEPEQFRNSIKDIYTKILPSLGMNKDDSVVLSLMHKGSCGSIEINKIVKQIYHPVQAEKKPEIQIGKTCFSVDDPVIQQKNNYRLGVFNGDIGKIISITEPDNKAACKVNVDFSGKIVEYMFCDLLQLSLAYAISVHKSQGSEFEIVIIPVFTQHFMLLKKKVIYTAITRAKKLCIVVGQWKALAIAIKSKNQELRTTFLQQFLTGL